MAKKGKEEIIDNISQLQGYHGEGSPYEKTHDLVRKHLSDPNHQITDDDIRNAYTGKPVVEDKEDPKLTKSRKKDIKQSREEDKDPVLNSDEKDMVNPSNIIGT